STTRIPARACIGRGLYVPTDGVVPGGGATGGVGCAGLRRPAPGPPVDGPHRAGGRQGAGPADRLHQRRRPVALLARVLAHRAVPDGRAGPVGVPATPAVRGVGPCRRPCAGRPLPAVPAPDGSLA